jgi:hypothetical protein
MAHPLYLTAAVKIIMHSNYIYTKDNPQRIHLPLLAPRLDAPPVAPDVDTGVGYDDLRVGMKVKVWWLDEWWHAKV